MMQKVGVLLPVPLNQIYDYAVPESMSLTVGDMVLVPFGSRRLYGVVWRISDLSETAKPLKEIYDKFVLPAISPVNLEFIEWVANYTLTPLGAMLKLMLSVPQVFKILKRQSKKINQVLTPHPDFSPIHFSPAQNVAYQDLKSRLNQGYSVSVLDGVTGSGKTEVYLELIAEVLRNQKQALVLLPEISLSPQMIERFTKRFGASPSLWHSLLTPAQRRETWKQILKGEAKVIIGARSALFLPYSSLGLIVVDEEHEQTYKQDEGAIYQGRDMAVVRASLDHIPIILASATPSLETYHNCQQGRYHEVSLENRFGEASLPEVEIIDLKESKSKEWISAPLFNEITKTTAAGEQVLLFLNRRGYAPLTLCSACGTKVECPFCTAWLVDHRVQGRLICHYCGHAVSPLKECMNCHAKDSFIACGPGVERLAEEVIGRFPHLKYCIISSDLISNVQELDLILSKIKNNQVSIIIGTQMIAKGHHFPHLTLVGVIDADLGLQGGDLRGSERTYQLLQQVGGRAGREQKLGKVLLQTYYPEHPVMQALITGQRTEFLRQELLMRESNSMPPFSRLAALILTGMEEEKVKQEALRLVSAVPRNASVEILGPAPSPIYMIRGRYRWRILVKAPRNYNLQKFLKLWLYSLKLPSSVRLKVDIDPYNFL
jgi:primosomal protein N' (replication factor Y)